MGRVTDSGHARSRGVSQALVAVVEDTPQTEGLSFDDLYRSSRDDVYAYAAGLLRDRNAAEDVTATAFERAYRKRSRFDARRGSARAWLFGIARNAALDELRRRNRQRSLAVDAVDAATLADGAHSERSELRILIAAALGELAAAERELIALKFFAGLSNAEIAQLLGISESNAGTKLHRVVNKLREACHGVA